MAVIKTVAVGLQKKWNLGNYEMLQGEVSVWVTLSEEEDEDAIIQAAVHKCKYHLHKAFKERDWEAEKPYRFNVALGEIKSSDLEEEDSFEDWRRQE